MRAGSSQAAKEALGDILDQLPSPQQQQVLDCARFLRQQGLAHAPLHLETVGEAPLPPPTVSLHLVPATSLIGVTGLVSLGGRCCHRYGSPLP